MLIPGRRSSPELISSRFILGILLFYGARKSRDAQLGLAWRGSRVWASSTRASEVLRNCGRPSGFVGLCRAKSARTVPSVVITTLLCSNLAIHLLVWHQHPVSVEKHAREESFGRNCDKAVVITSKFTELASKKKKKKKHSRQFFFNVNATSF